MLTTEEIKKALDTGNAVGLECVDVDMYCRTNSAFKHEREVIARSSLVITSIIGQGDFKALMISDCRYCIPENDLKHFRIKRPAPLLSDLKTGGKVFIREDLEDEKEYERGHYFFKDNMKTGEQILNGVCDGLVEIKDDHLNRYTYSMIDWEKTIKLNANKAPAFDDLIDVAVQAKKDGVVSEIHWSNDQSLSVLCADGLVVSVTEEVTGAFIRDAINDINSLYTEAFLIECEEGIKKVNIKDDNAKITLANGVELGVIGSQDSTSQDGLSLGVLLPNGGFSFYGISVLKGATVTQKRGEV